MMKGIYLLIVSVNKKISVKVGALGTAIFDKGLYVYVGSAQRSLHKRIARHFKRGKRKFWHIDYLLSNDAAEILKVYIKEADKKEECRIAEKISAIGIPVKGFGACDCKCKSHLFKIGNLSFLRYLQVKEFSQ